METKTKANICRFCHNNFEKNNSKDVIVDKCQTWLDGCTLDDTSSVCSNTCESLSAYTVSTANSAMESGYVFQNNDVIISDKVLNVNNNGPNMEIVLNREKPKYENITICKSRKVHIGDVTYINGPVIINTTVSREQVLHNENEEVKSLYSLSIISRINWLAQPPLTARECLNGPAKFVIIAHTATEEGFTQADNTLLIRLIQTFHIESRKWDDIAYNFLIGSDGNIYEGRGWKVMGSHTRSYNRISVGISFVGCFLNHLPPEISLRKAKSLIRHGVEIGAISPEYDLLAHCQCIAAESPGKRLFEEIKSWDRWNNSINIHNPSPLISNS